MPFKLGYPMYFILDDQKKVVPVENDDALKWAEWWETNRFLADHRSGEIRVATIFLGIDPDLGTRQPPLLFESMVFHGSGPGRHQRNYATYEEAMAGHAELVRLAHADPWVPEAPQVVANSAVPPGTVMAIAKLSKEEQRELDLIEDETERMEWLVQHRKVVVGRFKPEEK